MAKLRSETDGIGVQNMHRLFHFCTVIACSGILSESVRHFWSRISLITVYQLCCKSILMHHFNNRTSIISFISSTVEMILRCLSTPKTRSYTSLGVVGANLFAKYLWWGLAFDTSIHSDGCEGKQFAYYSISDDGSTSATCGLQQLCV
jgi:hypothetical protein